MRNMKAIMIVLVLLFGVLIAGCSRQDAADAGPVIRVAVTPASPPNLFEEQGRTVGLDMDIFAEYCTARNCTMRVTAYDWQGMLGAVVSRQADVAFSGISITEPRLEVMDFSQPYMDNTWNLMSLTSRNIQIDDLAELKNYSIGYPRGMAYSDFIRNDWQPAGIYSLDQVKLYPSYNEVLADLQNGNLDLAFVDGTVATVHRRNLPIQDSYVLSGFDQFGFAFPKGSELRADFDQFLSEELGPERLAAIIAKWME